MGSSRYLLFPYTCVRLGFSNQQKVESREGDIITIQKRTDKMSYYSKFDRTLTVCPDRIKMT